jgi:hypothetical protein
MLARTSDDERREVVGDRNVFDVNRLGGRCRLGLHSASRHRSGSERYVRPALASLAAASGTNREYSTGEQERADHGSIWIHRAERAR